jgi:hypothetical protein
VSEPPEQEEEPEEPAADADLEELLEQFREPEEAPRPRANPLWLVSAILLSVLACWLALRASSGGAEDKPKSSALAGAMLPGKTSERLPRDEQPVDVVEDYLARCKKGMTAQEVRWIVEDFQRAGLDEELPAAASIRDLDSRRRAHHEWYLDLLIDGLGFDIDQRRMAMERLQLLRVEAVATLTREFEENERQWTWGILEPFVDYWLEDESYAPWKLCDLTAEQEAVTRCSEVALKHQQESDSGSGTLFTTSWLEQITPFRSALTDLREIHLADGDFGPLAAAGSIFPLEEPQLFDGEKFLRIEDPTRLHPAQLKMLLLLEPGRAAEIVQALERLGE